MSFGYIPHPDPIKNFILRWLGWPNLLRRMQAPDIVDWLDPQSGEKILDIGCSMGNLSIELARQGSRVTAIDKEIHPLSKRAARIVRGVKFMAADAQRLPFEDESFDKIVMSSVLQVVDDDKQVLAECRRVLKRGGLLVGTVPEDYKILREKTGWTKRKIKTYFGIGGKEFYTPKQIRELTQGMGFDFLGFQYSPRWWGNWLYQRQLVLRIKLRIGFFGAEDMVLYPLGYWDRLVKPGRQRDGEFIFSLRKR